MIYELNHVGLVIRDLKKSLDFYEGVLGARVVYEGFIPPSKTEVRYLQIGGGMIELLAPQEPKPDTDFGITHICFMTDDLDADHQKVVSQGYKELVAPKPAGSGVGRLSFISDPNGARVELIERDVKMRLPQEEHPVVKDFDHYSLIANDLDAAMTFYRDAMGLKVLKEMEVPARELSMVYLNHEYDVLELLHRPQPNTTDPMFGHFALRTDDVAAALDWVAEKGVPAEPGSPKMAGTGIGQVGLIRDPDGVKIEFVDRADSQGALNERGAASAEAQMATLELKDVRKAFGALMVISGVSMSVEDGEFVALVGPSGCGKSTLLRMIAGLETVTGGTVAIGNRVVNDLPPKARDIAMVFQSYALYPHMTAADNMGFSLRLKGTPAAEKEEQIGRASTTLGLGAFLSRFPRQLSGGQRQRVAMGRALVRNPQLFLFDEPLSNLDANLRVQMRAEIKELHQRLAATTIYVTHDQIEAMTMADKIVVLRDGLVEQIGPPLELYDRPANSFVGGFIGSPAMNFLPGRIAHNDGPVVECAGGGVLRLLADTPVEDGKKVVCGLRPEDLQMADGADGTLAGTVMVVEPTGSETMIRLRINDASVTAVFRERYNIHPGDAVKLRPTPGKIHLFEPADGRRIA